jgi:hypothetical protein
MAKVGGQNSAGGRSPVIRILRLDAPARAGARTARTITIDYHHGRRKACVVKQRLHEMFIPKFVQLGLSSGRDWLSFIWRCPLTRSMRHNQKFQSFFNVFQGLTTLTLCRISTRFGLVLVSSLPSIFLCLSILMTW